MTKQVITRFAPSPTGYLHIGGARTALFNWLFSKNQGGKFLLRIEDTDRERSTQAAVDALLDGLKWMGLDWDGEEIYQFSRADRHAQVARELVAKGAAYYCYCTPEELQAMREQAMSEKKAFRYDGRWRDAKPEDAPAGISPAIRLKAPREGNIIIADKVQGDVTFACEQLDDMVLLRSDGTPTYMLAVVVDDYDMGITHIIRGDDHLTNAARQYILYQAMGWTPPIFAHIPLIHGADGAKLSKRHGALGVEAYRDMGYLPETLRNYLLRLGWGHGDDEIISTEQAIAWFNLEGIGRSPSRMDFTKLDNLNGHYIREADNARLVGLILPRLAEFNVGEEGKNLLLSAMDGLKQRAKTINELADSAAFYVRPRPLVLNEKAAQIMEKSGKSLLLKIIEYFENLNEWQHEAIENLCRELSVREGVKLGDIAQPLRAAITGSNISPGMFEVMEQLGKTESMARLRDALVA